MTNERRRTATSMQNALTFKFRRWRRRRRKPLDGIRHFTDSLEEGGNRSSGTASSDKDNSSSSQGGVADERSKTNSHYDADAYSNDYGYLTVKDNVSEVGTARRSSSFHGLIRRTWRWRYVKISIGTSSTDSWRQNEEDDGDLEDI